MCIMPTMRAEGPFVKGFIESSFLDWPGKVASVVFLPGCNFRCPFCHNHALVLGPDSIADIPLGTVLASLDTVKGWVDGVVVSGGEPTLHPDLEGMLTSIKQAGFAVKLDTNGSRPDVIRHLLGQRLIDAVAMDIKAPLDPAAYELAAGVPVDVGAIRQSIALLMDSGLEVTFRATVVPGLHDEAAVTEMARTVKGRLILQEFRPDDALDPAYRLIKPFGPDVMGRLRDMAASAR